MERQRERVGVRELKTRLGFYLQRVRQGRIVIVTDRGEPIAELRALALDTSPEAVLAKLETLGAVTRPTQAALAPFRPVVSRGVSAAAALREDRHDRF